MPDHDTPPYAPNALYARIWEAAKSALWRLLDIYGPTQAFRDRPPQTRGELKLLHTWLRPLEDLVSRIIILEARALSKTLPPPPEKVVRPKREPEPQSEPVAEAVAEPIAEPKAKSSEWRVHFRVRGFRPAFGYCYQSFPRGRMVKFRKSLTPPRLLAGRLEAVRRVIDDPTETIRKLAEKFQRQPKIASQVQRARIKRAALEPYLREANSFLIDMFELWPRIRRLE